MVLAHTKTTNPIMESWPSDLKQEWTEDLRLISRKRIETLCVCVCVCVNAYVARSLPSFPIQASHNGNLKVAHMTHFCQLNTHSQAQSTVAGWPHYTPLKEALRGANDIDHVENKIVHVQYSHHSRTNNISSHAWTNKSCLEWFILASVVQTSPILRQRTGFGQSF